MCSTHNNLVGKRGTLTELEAEPWHFSKILLPYLFLMHCLQVMQVFQFERFETILTLHAFVKEKDLLHNTSKGAKWKGVHKSWIIPVLRAHRKWWIVQGTSVFMLSRCEYLQLCTVLVIKWNIRARSTRWVHHTLTRQSQTNYGSPWCFFTPVHLNTGCPLFQREVVKIVRE